MKDDSDNKSVNLIGTQFMGIKESTSKTRYTKREFIGEGGQAKVYRVFDEHVGLRKSMKIIHSQFTANKDFVKRFINEIRITSQLNYPNIVKVYDAGVEDGKLFIIMDYIDGFNLATRKRFPESIAALICSCVADALNYAHNSNISINDRRLRGIVHGDIKPGNLMVSHEGEIVVLDFGLANAKRFIDEHSSGKIFGTFAYAAPELFDNEKPDERSDIYSLGVTLYRLLTGNTGFDNDTEVSIIKKKMKDFVATINTENIHPDLVKIITKATAQNPDNRYDTTLEFKLEIEKFISENYESKKSSYKNMLGAYFNFQIEPTPKKQNTTILNKPEIPKPLQEKIEANKKEDIIVEKKQESKNEEIDQKIISPKEENFEREPEKTKPEKKKPQRNGKKKSFIFLISLIVIILISSIVIFRNELFNRKERAQISEEQKTDRTKTKEKEDEKPVPVAAVGKQEKKPGPEQKEVKKRPKPKPKPEPVIEQYDLIIINPQQLTGIVKQGKATIGELDRKHKVTIKIKKAGKCKISIENERTELYSYNLEFNSKNKSQSITYDPKIPKPEPVIEQYDLVIINPQQLTGIVKQNNATIGELDRKHKVTIKIKKTGTYKISIENERTELYSYNLEFNSNNKSQSITYDPIIKPEEEYFIVVRNPLNIKLDVFVDNVKKAAGSKDRDIKIKIDQGAGKYELRVVGNVTTKKTLELNKNNQTSEIEYIEYSLYINDNSPLDETVYIGDKTIGKLSENLRFFYKEPQQYTLKIGDPEDENSFEDFRINLDRNNPTRNIVYSYEPPEIVIYKFEIKNPNNIYAEIKIGEREPISIQNDFIETYDEPDDFSFEIIADGYEPVSGRTEFNIDNEFKFLYDPPRLPVDFVVTNTKENGTIEIDERTIPTRDKETIIKNLAFGKKYEIIINIDGYEEVKKNIRVPDDSPFEFNGKPVLGEIKLNPEIDAEIIDYISLSVDQKVVNNWQNSFIQPLGNREFNFKIQIGDAVSYLPIKMNVKKGLNELKHPIKKVSVTSTADNTMLYLGDKYIGKAPLTIPILSETLIKAEPPDRTNKEYWYDPKKNETEILFHYPNKQAEQHYIEAEKIVTKYKFGQLQNPEDDLTNALIRIEQGIAIDNVFDKLWNLKIYILSEQLAKAVRDEDNNLAIRILEDMDYNLGDIIKYSEDDIALMSIYKNMAKSQFLYADNYLEGALKKEKLEKKVMEYLENFLMYKNRIKTKLTNTERFDRDEGDFYYIKASTLLWEFTQTSEYKEHAKKMLRKNTFSDFSIDGEIVPNVFYSEVPKLLNRLK